MRNIIDVQIGQVKTAKDDAILRSKAIGSCVAVVAYDADKHIGALGHMMLPGRAPAKAKPPDKNKYVANATEAILSEMVRLGSETNDIQVVLVGGANVLKRKNDYICEDNIRSARQCLTETGFRVAAQAIGGTCRRSVSLDIERGTVSCAEGDSTEEELWRA